MKRLALLLPLVFLLACSDSTQPTLTSLDTVGEPQFAGSGGGGQVKVEVCHRNTDGVFNLITIAEPGFDAHIAHGDAAPGDPVPELAGYVFDDACVPVQAGPTCPCFDRAGLDAIDWWDTGHHTPHLSFHPSTMILSDPFAYHWATAKDDPDAGLTCSLFDVWTTPEVSFVGLGETEYQECRTLITGKAIDMGCPAGGGTCPRP